ncbi:hypothetical protein [Abyssisolibacter fermentans]|uniref:hypothetical protein n=1 Tax=Abyssisolibacter fermentans TaxID=1766203 RepID=UPI0008363D2E|nr:hypothetical protein [Abyssisolibacter fermentans]
MKFIVSSLLHGEGNPLTIFDGSDKSPFLKQIRNSLLTAFLAVSDSLKIADFGSLLRSDEETNS